MTLYEITENITEEPEEAVTIKEASKRLNRTVSRNKDRNLLLEYDLVRQKLLKKGRG